MASVAEVQVEGFTEVYWQVGVVEEKYCVLAKTCICDWETSISATRKCVWKASIPDVAEPGYVIWLFGLVSPASVPVVW